VKVRVKGERMQGGRRARPRFARIISRAALRCGYEKGEDGSRSVGLRFERIGIERRGVVLDVEVVVPFQIA